MTDNTGSPKESKPEQKPKGPPRHRSPNYPALSLAKAVERAKDVYDYYKQVQVPITSVHARWDYKPMSSLVLQTVAALNAYGFIEVSGDKNKRMVRLTDVAVKIVRDHPDRQGLLQKAALSPAVYAELWHKYKADGIPPDDVLSNYLEWDKHFNPKAIVGFIADFRDTIAFAKLTQADIIGHGGDGTGNGDAPSVGDEKPPAKNESGTPPPKRAELLKGGPNMLTDTLTLDEGMVAFQYPRQLSPEEYQDLDDWMKIQLRKIKRLIKTDSRENQDKESQ